MQERPVHQCECAICQSTQEHPDKELHHQINVLLSRLDEQQRRWYAAVESKRYGHGGIQLVAQISGLDEKTIRRGRQELALDLAERPQGRVRLPGAGRPAWEKKSQQFKNAS
jgi:hypothetical protein